MSVIVDIERFFNIAGSIPVVQIPSGALRGVGGVFQCMGGGIATTVGLCGESISPGSRHWIDARRLGQEHSLHGILNVTRGAAEAFFGALALGALGMQFELESVSNSNPQSLAAKVFMAGVSLVPLAIQLVSKNGFNTRIHYELPGNPPPKNGDEAPASVLDKKTV